MNALLKEWDCKEMGHLPNWKKAQYRRGLAYLTVPCKSCGLKGYLSGDVEWDNDTR